MKTKKKPEHIQYVPSKLGRTYVLLRLDEMIGSESHGLTVVMDELIESPADVLIIYMKKKLSPSHLTSSPCSK